MTDKKFLELNKDECKEFVLQCCLEYGLTGIDISHEDGLHLYLHHHTGETLKFTVSEDIDTDELFEKMREPIVQMILVN